MTDKQIKPKELNAAELEKISAAGKNLVGDETGFPAKEKDSLKEGLSKDTRIRK